MTLRGSELLDGLLSANHDEGKKPLLFLGCRLLAVRDDGLRFLDLDGLSSQGVSVSLVLLSMLLVPLVTFPIVDGSDLRAAGAGLVLLHEGSLGRDQLFESESETRLVLGFALPSFANGFSFDMLQPSAFAV